MLFSFIQNNYACIITCILFIVFVFTDRSFTARSENLFLVAIGICITLTIVDNLELYEAAKSTPTVARSVYSAIGYSLRPACAITILFIMHRNRADKIVLPVVLPMLSLFFINILCNFISIPTGLVFYYSANNSFYRGPLGFLPFLTAGLYLLAMVIYTFYTFRIRQYRENVIIFSIAGLSIIGTLMQTMGGYKATLNTIVAISTVFYYLYIHVSVYSTDPLTSAYNRRIFYLDAEKLARPSVFVCIDLNNLKKINDNQGHSAGDEALRTLSNTIRAHLFSSCTLYRTGGDEFMILARNISTARIDQVMREIQFDFANKGHSYTFAYGCKNYQPGDDIDTICNIADERMYTMKALMKANPITK